MSATRAIPQGPDTIAEPVRMLVPDQTSWLARTLDALSAVRALGCALTLMPFFFGGWKISKLWRNAGVINRSALLTEVEQLARQVGVARRIQVREVPHALVPITWGILYPKILVPTPAWGSWPEEQRRAILLHELSHVKRLDVLWQVFSRFVCSLYWFHPLVWFGYRRLRCERELACDDCVIESGIKASDYAQYLVCVAREFHSPTEILSVAMAQAWGLEQRI